jgi:hypothetical protein
VNALIKREFAPAEIRMRSVTAREVGALKNLDAARANLQPSLTPKVYVDIALQQSRRRSDFSTTTFRSRSRRSPTVRISRLLRKRMQT